MAAEGKKEFKVTVKFAPWQETKGGRPPFLDMIPGVSQFLAPGLITHKVKVDPRKWNQKDLEYEGYGMAKPVLQRFAVKLLQIQKQAESQLPPSGGKKRDWASIARSKAPMDKKVAKEAQDKLKKTWPKLYKEIENSISLRMEDIEADKGDNKKAIAGAKEALRKFNAANSSTMFTGPLDDLAAAIKQFSTDLQKSNADKDGASKNALKKIAEVEKDVNKTAKDVQQVVKYFLDTGKRMSKDAKSDPAMQKVGKVIMKEAKALQEMDDAVDALGNEIDWARDCAKDTESKPSELQGFVKDAQSMRSDLESIRKNCIGTVADIAKEFAAAQKEVKA